MSRSALLDCLKEGYSGSFITLLENFGGWCRAGANVKGLARVNSKSFYIIDEDAMEIDAALAQAQADGSGTFELFRMYYIKAMNMKAIKEAMKYKAQKDDNKKLQRSLRYVTNSMIRDVISDNEKSLYKVLMKRYLKAHPAKEALLNLG